MSDASPTSANENVRPLPVVASLWIGGDLSWLERLCLQSFVHAGHRVVLFSYAEIGNVPQDVERADANDIWTPIAGLLEATAPSYLADIFRISLMEKTDFVWVDTDVLCVNPLVPTLENHALGWTPWYGEVNNAVMRMPADSALFNEMKQVADDLSIIPEWLRPMARKKLKNTPVEDRLIERFRLKRTVLGPACLTYLAKRHVASENLFEPDVLFPVPWQFSDVLFNPVSGTEAWVTPKTSTVHLWSHMIRRHKKRKPYASSFIGKWITKLNMEDEVGVSPYPAARPDQEFE